MLEVGDMDVYQGEVIVAHESTDGCQGCMFYACMACANHSINCTDVIWKKMENPNKTISLQVVKEQQSDMNLEQAIKVITDLGYTVSINKTGA